MNVNEAMNTLFLLYDQIICHEPYEEAQQVLPKRWLLTARLDDTDVMFTSVRTCCSCKFLVCDA